MRNELINLLPDGRRRVLRRDYFIRLGAVAAMMVTALALAAAALFLPIYVFLSMRANTEKDRLADIESALSSSGDMSLSVQLAALSNSAARLSALAGIQPISATMRAVLAIAHPGIALSDFTYAPATSENKSTLAISGVAMTRDALRNYQLALQNASFASSADLPVSAYAKNTDIAFTITVTLAP